MDSDQAKLFIGGITWETNEDILKEYFSNYGEVLQTTVMREKVTGRPRGFGFVSFSDPSVVDKVLQDKHNIDGREVDVKRAMTRDEQQVSARSGNFNASRNPDIGGNIRTKKIFVGGLPSSLTEDEFRQYFEYYGRVNDAVIMYDQNTQRPRGFGFVTFDSEDAVDRVLHKSFHDVSGKQVEVKRALPKDANPGGPIRSGGGGYQGYGGSGGGSASGYEGRMDSGRYMHPPNAGSGYNPYESSPYGTGYGYGSNGIGYGAYGGYSGASAGYSGPAGAGYGTGPAGGARGTWGTQPPSGYGAMGYGNTGPWGAGVGGPGSGPTGQAPGGPMGYGGQGYGYGMYSGGDAYLRSSGAPGVGGPGYADAAWRADPTESSGNYGSQANGAHVYGGGYNGGQVRQVQQ